MGSSSFLEFSQIGCALFQERVNYRFSFFKYIYGYSWVMLIVCMLKIYTYHFCRQIQNILYMNQFLEYLKFNYKNTSHEEVQKLLEEEGIGIGMLLQQQTFMNMYKQSSFKATQIMTYDKIQTLVEYLTIEGPVNDRKRSYKYPLLACEILSSNNVSTIDYFFSNGPVIVEQSVYRKTSFAKERSESENQEEDQLNSESSCSSSQSSSSSISSSSDRSGSRSNSFSRSRKSSGSSIQVQKKTEHRHHHHHHRQKYRFISPLIDKMFKFFEGQTNYTLAGYICKVLTTFLKQKPLVVMEYILEPDKIRLLLRHIQSRSVGDFIADVLLFDIQDLIPQRKVCFDMLVDMIIVPSEIHVISNISPVIREIIQKISTTPSEQVQYYDALWQQFFCLNNFKKLLEGSVSDEERVVSYCPGVLYQYVCQILFKKQVKEQFIQYLKTYLSTFLNKSLEIFKQKSTTSPKKLGMGKIRLLETFTLFLQKDIAECQYIAAQISSLFPILLSLFNQYPLSNILHNQLLKFFKYLISRPPTCPLLSTFLEGNYLKDFITEKIQYNGNCNNGGIGYIGHLNEIAQAIRKQSSNNSAMMAIVLDPKFSSMYTKYIDPTENERNKCLGGFIKRKNTENIDFSKQKILQKYSHFFEKSPTPLFQLKQSNPNGSSNSALTMNLNFNKKTNIIKSNNRTSIDFETEQENADQKYWANHMNYDVDQLMDDL